MTFPTDRTTGFQTITAEHPAFAKLFQVLHPAATELYICSNNLEDLMARPRVSIVGSRKVSPYGRQVTEHFAAELAGQGVAIVSGLAFGVDSIAHRAALDAGGVTIAVLPSSLARIYPASHESLARRIIEQGGALISEYPVGSDIAFKNQFVHRNRIVSGLCDVLLIPEAAHDSGSIHTAEFALEQGKEVMVVPGNITSPTSAGTNNLIFSGRGGPALRPDDVLEKLGLERLGDKPKPRGRSRAEQAIIDLLHRDVRDGGELFERSKLEVTEYNQALTMLELTGRVLALGCNQWALR